MTVIWLLVAVLAALGLAGAVVAGLLRGATIGAAYHENLRWRLAAEGTWSALLVIAVLLPLVITALLLRGHPLQLLFSTDTLITILLAAPAALLVARGAFDFSIGGTAVLCAVVMGLLSHSIGDLSPIAAIALGAAIGALNGALVAVTRISPVLLTLGVGVATRGFAGHLSGQMGVFPRTSEAWNSSVFGVVLTVLTIAWVLGITALALFTRVGRQNLPSSGREETVSQRLLTLGLPLAMSGLAAGLAAVIMVLRVRQASTGMFWGAEAEVALAVLAGGTCFGGRHPMVIGAALAALAASLLMLCLMMVDESSLVQWVEGVAVVAAALASQAHGSIWNWAYQRRTPRAPRAFPVEAAVGTPERATMPRV